MTVEDEHTIDFISTSADGHGVELTVADHLNWEAEDQHISRLQAKIYRYLDFVESGEILEQYPTAANSALRIRVVLAHEPSIRGLEFLEHVAQVVRDEGVEFEFEVSSHGAAKG